MTAPSPDTARRIVEAIDAAKSGSIIELRKGTKRPRRRGCKKNALKSHTAIVNMLEKSDCDYGVIPDPNTILPDIDPKNGGLGSLADLESTYGKLPPTQTILSGGGGIHFRFKLPDGVTVRGMQGFMPGIDIVGHDGSPWYSVGVGCRHKSGNTYEWAPGLSPAEIGIAEIPPWFLDLLQEYAANKAEARKPKNKAIRVSNRRVKDKSPVERTHFPLTDFDAGLPILEGQRHGVLFGLACRWRNDGFASETILESLKAVYRERCDPGSHPVPEDELASIVCSAETYPRGGGGYLGYARTRTRVKTMRQQVEDDAWKGKAGATDRDVLNAMLELAWKTGKMTVHLTIDQLGEMAGVGEQSASRSRKRLCKAGWIAQKGRWGYRKAAKFQILFRIRNAHLQATPSLAAGALGSLHGGKLSASTPKPGGPFVVTDDAFRHHGLGKNARRALNLLSEAYVAWPTGAAVGSALKVSTKAANTALNHLGKHGLARHTKKGWKAISRKLEDVKKKLDEVRKSLRSFGTMVRQVARHAIDRVQLRIWEEIHAHELVGFPQWLGDVPWRIRRRKLSLIPVPSNPWGK